MPRLAFGPKAGRSDGSSSSLQTIPRSHGGATRRQAVAGAITSLFNHHTMRTADCTTLPKWRGMEVLLPCQHLSTETNASLVPPGTRFREIDIRNTFP